MHHPTPIEAMVKYDIWSLLGLFISLQILKGIPNSVDVL